MTPATATAPQAVGTHGFLEPQPRKPTPWLLASLCLIIPILPSSSVLPGPLRSNGSPAKLMAIALLGLAILGFVVIGRTAKGRTLRPGVVIVLVYFLAVLMVYGVGVSLSSTDLVATGSTRQLIILFANVGIALYATTRITTHRERAILLGCLAMGLTFNCAAGLLQNLTQIDLHLLFQPPGFVVNHSTGIDTDVNTTERLGAVRAFGTSGHPIEFSVLAAITVPLAMHFARFGASRQIRLFGAAATGVALLAVPTGISRSGVVVLAAALFIYMWTLTLRGFGIAVLAGVIAIGVEALAAPRTAHALWQTIVGSANDDSVLERVEDYTRVSQTFNLHPAFGLGLGASQPTEYGFLDNEWLQALVQGGAVGLMAMLLLVAGGVFGLAAALRRARTPRERDQAYAMGAMLIGIIASSFTFDLFTYQQATLVFFLLFGLLWSNYMVPFPDSKQTPLGQLSRAKAARRSR